ncbi:ribonucleoside-diphosphate reductase subunit alpha [Limnochorda pilosa]|uniref:ribonucleoside-diphosphate reductase subunit alpha n=1 Tax=Limnochorda pilosa TaxID=1555112 RepID=UPI0026E98A73|nr:ribonucleoside-diphosphate reductase subunit alpha [Limnochorda pilosa]
MSAVHRGASSPAPELAWAVAGIEHVSLETLAQAAAGTGLPGLSPREQRWAQVYAARALIVREPNYARVAARLLLDIVYHEALGLEMRGEPLAFDEVRARYPALFQNAVQYGVRIGRVSPDLLRFDLDRLARALRPERDQLFSYLGLQTLYDRYFIHEGERRLETPQLFWMRVAMGLALNEDDPTRRAIQFYELMSTFRFCPSSPTLFNAGTVHPQLSSCFLTTIEDDLHSIFMGIYNNAMLSKWSGGLGNDWTPVRALGSHIRGTNGRSQGVIPFLKVANDTAIAVNQGGKRRGAVCAYLETWHLDLEDFMQLRRNTGDERRRTHDMHTAHWIPDLFMKRVEADGEWTLFSPSDVPDLHDLYGRAFEERYLAYEAMADRGKLTHVKRVKARELWRRMLGMLYETGHPWITFKDAANLRNTQAHAGVIHSSNLCTEILLNTSPDEVAVCNLGSINLAWHVREGRLDEEALRETVTTAVRMLDNVIDINFYPIEAARRSNLRHRPIGLGIMGFQDALHKLQIPYGSEAAMAFADESMETIAYHAILASAHLARERGPYPSYAGSAWSQGLLPQDTLERLEAERGVPVEVARGGRLDWTPVREAVRRYGMRNSNVLAIAPTATISNILGVSQSIEPDYRLLYTKTNLSGDFAVVNPYLVEELRARGLWDEEMVEALVLYDGILAPIERIPPEVKERFRTAFEIDPRWLIEAAARRQKWIDMGQSLNLYLAEPSGRKLDEMYRLAWRKGLKTTYYLRTLGASQVEKSTIQEHRLVGAPRWRREASQLAPGPAAGLGVAPGTDGPEEEGAGCEVCQ